jgi:predicted ATPase/DNA-binding SARP family transcriptional activator
MRDFMASEDSHARPGEFRLSLLGRFNLEQDGRALRLPTRKEEGLLAYLVLHPGLRTREALASLYWGDTTELQARGSLRAALAGLRAALGPGALMTDRGTIQLSPCFALRVDVREFEAQATRFLRDSEADPAAFDPALYGGELLSGHYDDWVLGERERLRQLYLDALLHLVGRLRASASFDAAIVAAREALAVDPAEERAHQHLIYLYAAGGNRPAALRQLELCRRSLKEELGVEPSPETLAVVDSVVRAPLPIAPPPPVAPPLPASANLPVPLTSFVGRERELAEVNGLLQAGAARLLTLTGAGGSGKTRLAIQAARQLLGHWPGGVWWSDLSTVHDAALLPQTVLASFDVAVAQGQSPLEALTGFLRERAALLVLDNCEHLAESCAHLVAAVLSSCPYVQVLATSREPLGVPGEQLWPVPTFSVPLPATELDVAALEGYDAVRLFVARAGTHQPGFGLTRDNASNVAEICRRLDGIPLAIELAAARVRTMALDDILTRLQKRLRLLALGSSLAPPRHQTLRASIDWTYNQLTPAECLLLQRLAVFVGGWTLSSAEAICAGEGLAEEEVLDTLSRLVDRSLVVTEAGRYRMLETIREYALERLADSGEAEAVRDRHSAYYLALVRALDGRLCSGEQKAALARMEAEIANIRLALEWTIVARQYDRLADISFPLLYFYEIRGWLHEGEAMFRDAGAKLDGFEETDAELERRRQTAVLDMKTNRAYFLGAFAKPGEAYALHCECMARLRGLGDRSVLRYSLRYGGNVAGSLGKFDEAEACLKESLALSQEAGRAWDIGIVNAYLGYITKGAGALERSQDHFHQAIQMGRQLGDPRLLAYALTGFADLLLMLGQPFPAQALAEEALPLAESTGDRLNLARSWGLLGEVATALGAPKKARSLLVKSMALWQEIGRITALTEMYGALGSVALSAGDLEEAETQFRAALTLSVRYERVLGMLSALTGLAAVLGRRGDAEAAAALLAVILCQPLGTAETRQWAEELRAELEGQLTPEQLRATECFAVSERLEMVVKRLLAIPPDPLA